MMVPTTHKSGTREEWLAASSSCSKHKMTVRTERQSGAKAAGAAALARIDDYHAPRQIHNHGDNA